MSTAIESDASAVRHRPSSGRRAVWGLLLILSGVLAIAMPAVAALATALVFAWLLLLAGSGEVLSILIAGLVAIGWPEGSIVFVGLLTGIWLILAGVWRLLLRPPDA